MRSFFQDIRRVFLHKLPYIVGYYVVQNKFLSKSFQRFDFITYKSSDFINCLIEIYILIAEYHFSCTSKIIPKRALNMVRHPAFKKQKICAILFSQKTRGRNLNMCILTTGLEKRHSSPEKNCFHWERSKEGIPNSVRGIVQFPKQSNNWVRPTPRAWIE